MEATFSKPMQRSSFEKMVRLSKVLDAVFVTAIVTSGLISFNLLQTGFGNSSLSVLGLFLLTIALYGLYRRGYFRLAGTGLVVTISIVVTYNLVIGGGIHDNAMVVFPLLITTAGLILGKRFIPYLTGLFLIEISLIYWLSATGQFEPFNGQITIYIHNYLTVFLLLVISGSVIWITVYTLEKNFIKIIDSESALRNSYDQTLHGWGKALELFDRETEGHSIRVSQLAVMLAERVGVPEEDQEQIFRGALLHDIGKMGIDEDLLNKPESLSPDERLAVEKHPLNAHKLLMDIPFLAQAMEIPVYHHEQWDGDGYPFQLQGEEIPLSARIFALVDNWDALLSDRPYRKAWPKEQVVRYIREQSGEKFDPALVEQFIALVE
jgi:putative nucleotidyltransferase with HDIG domain